MNTFKRLRSLIDRLEVWGYNANVDMFNEEIVVIREYENDKYYATMNMWLVDKLEEEQIMMLINKEINKEINKKRR